MSTITQSIIIDDGTREIPIYNMFGDEICTIRIRPADISIMDRFNDLQESLATMFEPLSNISIRNDGTADENSDDWETLKSVESALIESLNALLDTTGAAAIFEKRNVFSSVNGKFFCENIIDAIGELIANAIKDESEKTQSRIEKYLPSGGESDGRETSGQSIN